MRPPRPTPHPITCADDSCLNACLSRIDDVLETQKFNPIEGDYAGKNANLNLVIYQVKGGSLGEPNLLYIPKEFKTFQESFETQQLVWNYASAMLPPEQLKWISEFYIFTDGPENILAWVNSKDIFDRSHWQLGVDITDAEHPVYLTYTVTHEVGHLITLNTGQIPQTEFYSTWSQNPGTCSQFHLPEGCTNPDSYINLFYQQFWIDIFEEWREKVEQGSISSEDELDALVREFYEDHEDQFVRQYAATNIREDIAESFMHFVLGPNPGSNTLRNQKISFFYDFPELVALRKQIIQNVCSYTHE